MQFRLYMSLSRLATPRFLKLLQTLDLILLELNSRPILIKNQNAATIGVNLGSALEKLWPSLLSGTGGQTADPELLITNVNQELFTVGRIRFVEQMLSDLQSGYIDTGVDPISGELQ